MASQGDYKITVKVDGKEYVAAVHVEDVSSKGE
jgi:hypothetical protein